MSDGGFAPAGATRGLCARPLDPFAVHTPMLWGFIFLCYIEHLTRTAGSLDKHAGTLCSCAQPNRAEGSREKLPCGLKGQRPLGSPNKHAEEVCRSHQLNRAKGSPEGRRPFGRVKGQRPLGSLINTRKLYEKVTNSIARKGQRTKSLAGSRGSAPWVTPPTPSLSASPRPSHCAPPSA